MLFLLLAKITAALSAQPLTQQELARLRQEKTQVERQIDQLMPQIRNLSQQAATFNQQHRPTVQQALEIAVRNEINDNALPVWQSTHNPNFRTNFNEMSRHNEVMRRTSLAEEIHRRNIQGVLDNFFENKLITLARGTLHFENESIAISQARLAARERYGHLSNQAMRERADAAGVAATRDNGGLIDITNKSVTRVECRDINRRYVQARNQEAHLRQQLSTLRSQYASGGR